MEISLLKIKAAVDSYFTPIEIKTFEEKTDKSIYGFMDDRLIMFGVVKFDLDKLNTFIYTPLGKSMEQCYLERYGSEVVKIIKKALHMFEPIR